MKIYPKCHKFILNAAEYHVQSTFLVENVASRPQLIWIIAAPIGSQPDLDILQDYASHHF